MCTPVHSLFSWLPLCSQHLPGTSLAKTVCVEADMHTNEEKSSNEALASADPALR